MLRILAIVAIIAVTISGQLEGTVSQFAQPDLLAGALIALLLGPTLKRVFE